MSPFPLSRTLLNELALFLVWNNGCKICNNVVGDEDVNAFSKQQEEENTKVKLNAVRFKHFRLMNCLMHFVSRSSIYYTEEGNN